MSVSKEQLLDAGIPWPSDAEAPRPEFKEPSFMEALLKMQANTMVGVPHSMHQYSPSVLDLPPAHISGQAKADFKKFLKKQANPFSAGAARDSVVNNADAVVTFLMQLTRMEGELANGNDLARAARKLLGWKP